MAIENLIAMLFGSVPSGTAAADITISIAEIANGVYAVDPGADTIIGDDSIDDLAGQLGNRAIGKLVDNMTGAVALHAGAVLWKDQGILVPGATMAGKTSLVAWFLDRGCRYLSDEIVILPDQDGNITGFPRALVFKAGCDDVIAQLSNLAAAHTLDVGTRKIVRPKDEITVSDGCFPCGLIIFPQYVSGATASITPLTPAEAGFRLMACAVNARNFEDGGLAAVTAVARRAPAFTLRYGGFEQLDGALDMLAELVLERGDDAARIRRFLSACGGGTGARYIPPRYARHPATLRPSQPKKLTIGMATYDDYDGVYFTLHALRLYHAEVMEQVELLVVDNHPDGPCAKQLKDFENYIANYRYVPVSDMQGTTVKEVVFREAAGDYVLCIDCHVLIRTGGIKALIDYFEANPATSDLIQGPLVSDNLSIFNTHQEPKWLNGMFGAWPAAAPISELPKRPIEIPFSLMALFACRRDAWVGLNPAFRGWGIEEWYIHEKFRRAGGKIICLPALQYIHRFNRPLGVPYRHNWEDRIRNYTIALRELDQSTADMEAHFRELLGKDHADVLIEAVRAEMSEA